MIRLLRLRMDSAKGPRMTNDLSRLAVASTEASQLYDQASQDSESGLSRLGLVLVYSYVSKLTSSLFVPKVDLDFSK